MADGDPISTSTVPGRPRVHPRGRDRRAHDLVFRRGQHVGDVEVPGDRDVHAGGDVRLRVEIDDERRDALREGGGCEPERHRGLSHAPVEGADAEHMHK